MEQNNQRLAIRISVNTIVLNVLLSAFKLVAGIVGHSAAMVSDAIHSLSDVVSTLIVIFGLKAASKKADKEHPYGHERFECVASIILAIILGVTGAGIGLSGIQTILSGHYEALAIPSLMALIAAITSIVVKEGMYWYTRAYAVKINSTSLMADAWHHRSDAFSSVGSLAGIAGARMGYPVVDSVACLIICFFIVKAAYDIFMDAINKMTDRSSDDETVEEIRALVLAQEKVLGIDLLRTRLFGDRIYVDVEISVDGSISLSDSHDIAHSVHDALESHFPNIKHCMIHVNPEETSENKAAEIHPY